MHVNERNVDGADFSMAVTEVPGLDPLDPFGLPEPEAAARSRQQRPPRARRSRAVRAVHLGIRVLASERSRLAAAAKRAGYRDTSSWCRGTLIAACNEEGPPLLDEALLTEVARLRRDLNSGPGANLNQALLHANARAKGGLAVDGDALAAAVAAAQAALEALRIDMGRLLGPQGRA